MDENNLIKIKKGELLGNSFDLKIKNEDIQPNMLWQANMGKEIKWWIRFLLLFKKYIVSVDMGKKGEDETVYVYYKKLNGKTYILKVRNLWK